MQFIFALIISVVTGAVAQLLMKLGTKDLSAVTLSLPLIAGIGCYVLAMAAWIFALKRYPLNVAYPLLSIGYLVVYIGAAYLPGFDEQMSWQKTAGVCLVILGVAISAQTSRRLAKHGYATQHSA